MSIVRAQRQVSLEQITCVPEDLFVCCQGTGDLTARRCQGTGDLQPGDVRALVTLQPSDVRALVTLQPGDALTHGGLHCSPSLRVTYYYGDADFVLHCSMTLDTKSN